jgi:uncharacterized protein (TIGR02145 family)
MKKLIIPILFLLLSGCSKEVVRYHGHQYKVIEAGSQRWMAENLQTSKYRSGKKIPLINDLSAWPELTSGACGFFGGDTSRLEKYGMFYNWKAIDEGKLCPFRWSVPTNDNWLKLEEFLGGEMRAGGKMKSITGWKGKHVSGDDIGFNARPGGYRLNFDTQEGESTVWWSSSIARMNKLEDINTGVTGSTNDPGNKWIWGRRLERDRNMLMNTVNRPNNGFYVRCVKKGNFNKREKQK